MLSVGGLFSGIGGWELGLERAGMRVLWHCESDPYARAVLERHWPGVPCYPDVRELRGADVEPVDVLCGGFPCQDISVAGRGAGIAGERSGLWSEYARMVGELRPRYVLVENVPALLARGLGRVLGDLAALGYDAEWDCLPARAFGAPHLRDRLWLVAYPSGDGCDGGKRWPERDERPTLASPSDAGQLRGIDRAESGRGDSVAQQSAGRARDAALHLADAARHVQPESATGWAERQRTRASGQRGGAPAVGNSDEQRRNGRAGQLGSAGRREPADPGWWLVEPDVGRVADGIPSRVDRLRCLGNALVPQIAEWIGRRVMAYENLSQTVPDSRREQVQSGDPKRSGEAPRKRSSPGHRERT